jgi:hypothetical protein
MIGLKSDKGMRGNEVNIISHNIHQLVWAIMIMYYGKCLYLAIEHVDLYKVVRF